MKLPKTQQLVIFQAVALNRSINAAARALKLPQSTLSRALKELEETLNCQLLERGGAGVTLTPAGNSFLKYAGSIVRTLNQAVEETGNINGKSLHTISFAVPSCISRSILNNVITSFLRSEPRCHLNIEVVPFSTSLERMEKGLLDFAVGFERENVSFTNFTVEPLVRCPAMVACVNGDTLENATSISEIKNANWLITDEFEIWQKEHPEALQIQPSAVVRSQGYFVSNLMIARNGFLGLLSSVQIRRHRDYMRPIPLKGFPIYIDYALAYPKNRPRTPLVERLLDYMRKEAKSYDWEAFEIKEGSPETPYRSQVHDLVRKN